MIVFDASTLILLARTEILEKFLDAALNVCIPKEVKKECCEQKRSEDALLIQRLIKDNKITVRRVRQKRLCEKVRTDFNLGTGESEALALALVQKASLVGTDDKRAINACKVLKIPFATALGILIRMVEKGLLEKEEGELKLAALAKYGRYKRGMVEDAKSRLEAKRWPGQ